MYKTSFVISGCKTSAINVDKIWFSVIEHYREKIFYNMRKYIFSSMFTYIIMYCITLSIFIISPMFLLV